LEKEIYKFLRKAVRHIDKNKPFRGSNFKEGRFSYVNDAKVTSRDFREQKNVL